MTKPSTLTDLNLSPFKSVFGLSASSFGQLGEISKKNAEAITAATSALAQGTQSLCAQSVAFSKETAERNFAAVQALAGAKTPQEAIEVQTAHLQASIERFIGEVSKISETYSTSVKSAAAPLRDRVAAALKAAAPVA